jgi:hypothetical protein
MSIAITVKLPESVAERPGNNKIDLSPTALEVIALEGYRSDRLTGFQVIESWVWKPRCLSEGAPH